MAPKSGIDGQCQVHEVARPYVLVYHEEEFSWEIIYGCLLGRRRWGWWRRASSRRHIRWNRLCWVLYQRNRAALLGSISMRLLQWLGGNRKKPAVDVGREEPRSHCYDCDVDGERGERLREDVQEVWIKDCQRLAKIERAAKRWDELMSTGTGEGNAIKVWLVE